MEVVKLGEKYVHPMVLCLGFFDCMHSGHVKLLEKAQTLAGRNAKVVLFTFLNNHFETMNRSTKLLYTFDERLGIYADLGVDAVLCAEFDKAFMSVSGEEFLKQLSRYDLRGVVCGKDFTCGSNLLPAENVKRSLQGVAPVEIVDIVTCNNQKVSSTLVRQLLSEHQVEQANTFLSQPFFFEGSVEQGRHVGGKLGFPTANLPVSAEKLAPEGVYVGQVLVDGTPYKAIVNVGTTPTFNFSTQKVEAHLLNFNGNLYGKKVKIALLNYIRPIQKFADEEQLAQQLAHDCEVANDKIRT